jgi:hypothetical protein
MDTLATGTSSRSPNKRCMVVGVCKPCTVRSGSMTQPPWSLLGGSGLVLGGSAASLGVPELATGLGEPARRRGRRAGQGRVEGALRSGVAVEDGMRVRLALQAGEQVRLDDLRKGQDRHLPCAALRSTRPT